MWTDIGPLVIAALWSLPRHPLRNCKLSESLPGVAKCQDLLLLILWKRAHSLPKLERLDKVPLQAAELLLLEISCPTDITDYPRPYIWVSSIVLLCLLAIVTELDRAHLCFTRGVRNRPRIYGNKVYDRDLYRDTGRNIHHLRILAQNEGLAELGRVMPGQAFLTFFYESPFT